MCDLATLPIIAPVVRSALIALVLLLAGCGSTGRNPAAALAGESAQRLLVLPLNVVATLPSEFEEPSALVWKQLQTYLELQGKQMQTLSLIDARRLWRESIQQVKMQEASMHGFDAAAQILALELTQYADFDDVIIPSLFVRQARMQGKRASWDGVGRTIEIEGEPRTTGSIYLSSSLSGTIRAASLHVVVLDAQGTEVHEGLGGLEVVDFIHVFGDDDDSISQRRWVFGLRPDLFSNREHLREGISEAFDPFLPPVPLAE
jgi:hypothetical protein